MKIVIIDDDKAMHLIMRRMLGKIEEVEIVGCFLETTTAFSFVENHEVDLVFVDISMPRETGLDFVQRLRTRGVLMKIVFVTSHKEHALSAFDVHAYDYIVKPVTQERLQRTVQRALSERRVEGSQVGRMAVTEEAGPVEKTRERKGADFKAEQETRINPLANWPDTIGSGELVNQFLAYQKSLKDFPKLMSGSSHSDHRDAMDCSDASPILIDSLTNRETEILLSLAEGLSNKEIADRFILTEGTVKNHLYNLYSKLSVKSRSQAIKRARELRILS
jgi:DNA-binding NarL/FixJ family response regulator